MQRQTSSVDISKVQLSSAVVLLDRYQECISTFRIHPTDNGMNPSTLSYGLNNRACITKKYCYSQKKKKKRKENECNIHLKNKNYSYNPPNI